MAKTKRDTDKRGYPLSALAQILPMWTTLRGESSKVVVMCKDLGYAPVISRMQNWRPERNMHTSDSVNRLPATALPQVLELKAKESS